MFKKIFFGLVAFAILSVYALPKIATENKEFKVVFLDVGQGDASLIKMPGGQTILIDGGPNNVVLNRLGEHMPFYRRTIDTLIISHWHDDHIIGLREILERYRVYTLIYMAGGEKNELAEDILKTAQRLGVKILVLKNEQTLNYQDNCSLNLLSSLSLGVKENGNNSIIARLNCHGLSFMLSGDNELAVEKALLASGINLKVDILKASHHGSKTSNSREFLEALQPRLVVIPVGADNKFNHPADVVLEMMADLRLNVKRTDLDSSVIIRRP